MQRNRMSESVGAVVLAAGRSTRMGSPKMTLPWGTSTVIGRVVSVLAQAGIGEIVVVTGGDREAVEKAVCDLPRQEKLSIRTVFNPAYAAGEMLSSFQAGLAGLGDSAQGALVTLGDQPQIEAGVVREVVEAYVASSSPLVIPSVRRRRGHPWLVDRALWPEALALNPPQTLRDLQQGHAGQIHYVEVATASILLDLDTPEDYRRALSEQV